jgi:hypothetical protein
MSLKDHIDRFRKSFIEKGLQTNDIEIALKVFAVLAQLDMTLFPGNLAGIQLCLVPSKRKFFAQYCKPAKNRRSDHYTIFVPGLYNHWQGDSKIVFIDEKDGEVVIMSDEQRRKLTADEFAITLAVHEVRHRLQFQYGRRLDKFNAWTWKYANEPLLYKLGKFVYHLNVAQRRIMIRDGFPKKFARERTNSEEFDSMVIEYLVLHRLSRTKTFDDLLGFMKVGPYSVLPKNS